jgi:hypothetical protein
MINSKRKKRVVAGREVSVKNQIRIKQLRVIRIILMIMVK